MLAFSDLHELYYMLPLVVNNMKSSMEPPERVQDLYYHLFIWMAFVLFVSLEIIERLC
jgi:hypothetical protein